MPGPSEKPPSGVILDFFDGDQYEPFTTSEIADATGYSSETVRTELSSLADRGLLETKEVDGDEQVWWARRREHADGEPSEPVLSANDAVEREGTQAARQRLMEQHHQLAQFVTRIDITDDLDEILRLITEEARELVGAHQSVTSRTVNQNWEQAINAVSLSEKYAEYREYDTRPDGSGIYSLVCERNQPMRMTQAELESHPAWEAFGDEADEHPPMRGWLAVPIVGPDGRNMGLIQLSDKYQGEFTEADEAILVQLANVAAAAIENAQLYDELRESEERYRTLFESMTEGYCVVEELDTAPGESTDFRLVEANPAFENHIGRREVVGSTLREVIPDEPGEWLDVLDRVAQTGDAVALERELESRERVLQCQVFPVGDAPDGRVGMTVQDITERVEHERRLKEREQALQESRNQLRALIDVLPVAVFVAEADGEIVEWNDAAEDIWGGEVVESESVAEYDQYEAWWADTGEPVEPEEWPLARALEGEAVTDPDEIRIKGFDGEYRTVLNHGMPVRDAGGEVSRAVVTLVDITERKEYERRLEASNERLEQFAYAASHDLQEPLRMVSSYLQLLERRYGDELDEDGREFIDYAVDGADRMREMIQGLLEYSRVETEGDPFEPVDLDDVLADVREDLHVRIAETGAEITSDELPTVSGDSDQLRQVLQNLLENAIEYSGDEPPRVHVGAERDGDEWAISVRDEGIGIDPDEQERIFQVFERLHGHDEQSGTGIGLALCQRIVERHGGDIWVESTPEEGSTFRFTVPRVE